MTGRIVGKIVAALVLILALAGLAYFAFNAGVAQGVATKLPEASSQAAPVPAPYPYVGAPFFWHPYPFFGFGFGCFGPLLGLFLVFFALRAFSFLFWGHGWGHRWGHMHGGHWGHGEGEQSVPHMFSEWHRRAHEDPGTEKKE
jgi:hypothetical protein